MLLWWQWILVAAGAITFSAGLGLLIGKMFQVAGSGDDQFSDTDLLDW